jgi:hypothetical protein
LSSEAFSDAKRKLHDGATVEGLAAIERAVFLAIEAATAVKGRGVLLTDLARTLCKAGLDDATARESAELLEQCQEARFGAGAQRAAELLGRTKACLQHLGKHRRRGRA